MTVKERILQVVAEVHPLPTTYDELQFAMPEKTRQNIQVVVGYLVAEGRLTRTRTTGTWDIQLRLPGAPA